MIRYPKIVFIGNILIVLFTLFTTSILAQSQISKKQVGLSIPAIWNNTEVFNVYSGARARYISGKAISYGLNANYTQFLFRGLFVTGGVGYFNQNFGVERPFDFNGDYTALGYHTKRYTYSSIHLLVGAGYQFLLNKHYLLAAGLTFNQLFSYRQKYVPAFFSGDQFKKFQIEKSFSSFGQFIYLSIGTSRKINQRFSAGADLVFPVYTKWRKDRIFREDEAEFYRSKFGFGMNFSLKYNLIND